MATKKSVGNLMEADLKGKKVLLHADLNVPLDDDQNITDDTRIRASVPTIKFLMEKGPKVILASHPGRSKGVTPKYSLKPLVPRLSELLEVDVVMANGCIGEEVQQLAASLPDGGVLLLEFEEEEEKNDPEFAKKLASVADIYVNDAFAHGAPLEGKTLPGVFASNINYDIVMAMANKNELPDKTTSHHISSDDGVSSEPPVARSRRTLPDEFAYEITGADGSVVTRSESRLEDKTVMIDHIPSDDGGRSGIKVQEGKTLSGVFAFDISDGIDKAMAIKNGLLDKTTSHHISSDDDGVSSELPVGKSRMTFPDDFAYEITDGDGSVVTSSESGLEGKNGGRSGMKVQEGNVLSGVLDLDYTFAL